jgi:hypothetical protein
LVGIDSIRKLTTPGSVETDRVQEESARRREIKEIKEAKDVKEKALRGTPLEVGRSAPLLPPPPL